MKLTNVEVERTGDGAVEVTYQWDGVVPEHGAVLWALYVTGEGGQSHELGYKLTDGRDKFHFAFDFATGRQAYVVANFALSENTLQVRFPASMFDGMGAWTWRAVLSIDGFDGEPFEGEAPA
jgi:hypothetical protein